MDETVRKNLKICETHFEQHYILYTKKNKRKYLSYDAFPTLNLPYANMGPSTGQAISNDEISITQVSRSVQTEMKRPDEVEANVKDKSVTKTDTKKLDKGLAQLVKWCEQTGEHQCSEGLMLFTLSLYKTSPNVYEFTKSTLSLPSPLALRKFFMPFATEVNQRLINVLTLKINEMTPHGKICCISVDCIPVKQGLFYDITNDRIVGFNEINGIQKLKFAKYAVVMMARGIIDEWQQPIAHCFLADFKNYTEVTDWVEVILTVLIEIGFDVRAFVTDHRSKIITPKPRNPDGSVLAVADHVIYRVFDAPRLIESMRAHLLTSQFIYKDDKVLTKAYLENKINSLDKILNYKKSLRSDTNDILEKELQQLQLGFLKQMLELFKNLRVVNNISRIDVTKTSNFIPGFQVTIKSILKLLQSFKSEGLHFRLTSRLNLNAIKNVFKKIKNKRKSLEPTCQQTSTMFKKTFLRGVMNGANQHQDDLRSLLRKIEEYPNVNQPLARVRPATSLAVEVTDYNIDLPDKLVIRYVAKYLYRKCFDLHSQCTSLNHFLSLSKTVMSAPQQPGVSNYTNVSQWTQTVPPDFFVDYVFLLEKKFQDYFKGYNVKNIANEIFKSIGYVIPSIPCSCFPFDYATKLFIRFRMYYTIKMNNAMIKRRKGKEKVFKVFNLSAL